MDAIVTAGGVPTPGDPLYEYTQGSPKALVDIAGKPMIQWVLDALTGATQVDQIVVVGLGEDSGVFSPKIRAFIPSHGGLMQNILAGIKKVLELNSQAHHVLSVSSDIPAIQAEMVDWVIQKSLETDEDAVYNVITRQTMEARFPNSRRSYIRLRDVAICGGDMNVIRTLTVTGNDKLWEQLIESRKNALKQASIIGFDTLLLVMFRLITLEQAVGMITRRLKLRGRALLCPYAEIGMDVDKPHQLEIMRADLQRRVQAAPAD